MSEAPRRANSPPDERAARIRNNKRRHRARQQEYVRDLERQLAELRDKGVQATREVQLAAQRVARENVRLRELLRQSGFDDLRIDSFVLLKQHESGMASKSPACAQQHGRTLPEAVEDTACAPSTENNGPGDHAASQSPALPAPQLSEHGHGDEAPSGRLVDDTQRPDHTAATAGSTLPAPAQPPQPGLVDKPCQLLSLLAQNPATDITQIAVPPAAAPSAPSCVGSARSTDAGVECTAAYRMLIQHANSEAKMDEVAQALEQGCTPSGEGGCRVKKSIVWKVLDSVVGDSLSDGGESR